MRIGPAPKTPEPFVFVLFVAAYSLGAHASLRRAAAGLVAAALVLAELSHNGGLGLAFSSSGDSAGVALALMQLTAFWLAGVFVRARRQAASNCRAERGAAAPGRAGHGGRTRADRPGTARHHRPPPQRGRPARRRGAGLRRGGPGDPGGDRAHSGRQALTETRRLFGVLREPDEETGRAPQPGISELPALARSLRAAGLEVSLAIDGYHPALSRP